MKFILNIRVFKKKYIQPFQCLLLVGFVALRPKSTAMVTVKY